MECVGQNVERAFSSRSRAPCGESARRGRCADTPCYWCARTAPACPSLAPMSLQALHVASFQTVKCNVLWWSTTTKRYIQTQTRRSFKLARRQKARWLPPIHHHLGPASAADPPLHVAAAAAHAPAPPHAWPSCVRLPLTLRASLSVWGRRRGTANTRAHECR